MNGVQPALARSTRLINANVNESFFGGVINQNSTVPWLALQQTSTPVLPPPPKPPKPPESPPCPAGSGLCCPAGRGPLLRLLLAGHLQRPPGPHLLLGPHPAAAHREALQGAPGQLQDGAAPDQGRRTRRQDASGPGPHAGRQPRQGGAEGGARAEAAGACSHSCIMNGLT